MLCPARVLGCHARGGRRLDHYGFFSLPSFFLFFKGEGVLGEVGVRDIFLGYRTCRLLEV